MKTLALVFILGVVTVNAGGIGLGVAKVAVAPIITPKIALAPAVVGVQKLGLAPVGVGVPGASLGGVGVGIAGDGVVIGGPVQVVGAAVKSIPLVPALPVGLGIGKLI